MITHISSREFNQDSNRAQKAALHGPVFITDCGQPAHVLLSMKDYQRLTGNSTNIIELLAMPEMDESDFEAPCLQEHFYYPADLS